MIDEIRTISIKELKKEIEADLEYAHPDKNKSYNAANAFDTSYGFKPFVNDNFFENENDAVKYILETEAIYQHLKDLEEDTKVIEFYDDEKDILHYTLFNESQTIRTEQLFFSYRTGEEITITFVFEEEQLKIIDDSSTILACKHINDEVCWSENKNIEAILSKEEILYPENLRILIEGIWTSWKKNESNAEKVEKDLTSLTQWINAMTKTKPSFV